MGSNSKMVIEKFKAPTIPRTLYKLKPYERTMNSD
jgi:hypothetical protein